jgi:hypothetical protein
MRKIHYIWKVVRPIHLRAMRFFGPSVFEGGPPAGYFNEVDAIDKGLVKGGYAMSGCSLGFNADSEVIQANLGQDAHHAWPVVWSHRTDTLLIGPSMVHVDTEGNACKEAMYGPHAWTDPVWKRHRRRAPIALSGPCTSITSRWNHGDNYFHWFLDGLTRLYHLDRFPSNTCIITPEHLPEFALRSIELLGLSKKIIPTRDCDLLLEDYWFAGPTMLSGCPDMTGVQWIRKKFLPIIRPPAQDFIYIDRGQRRRTCENSSALANWFRDRGWMVLDPAELSLDQQIETFSKAKAVAGIHGAGLTNLLWMPSGGKVLEIMPSKRRNGCYAGIAACIGLSHRAWILPSDRLGKLNVPIAELPKWITWMES